MLRRLASLVFASLLLTSPALAQKRALFDNTHAQTAGNADWIIDNDQPVAVPPQAGITWATLENYWTGANSAWGVQLVKRGYTVATLTSAYGISYQNNSNPYDLSNYDVFIVNEPNTRFSAAESTAMFNFVRDGGGLFVISDHNGSDRNSDGFDSPLIWNLFDSQLLLGVHFNVTGDPNNNISQASTNVNTSAADSIINGAAGVAPGIAFHAGTTMQLSTATNPGVVGDVWILGQPQGSLANGMVAHSTYGNGRIVFVSDSSPADDGTGTGGTLFPGWAESADSLIFLNGTIWATRRSALVPDSQPPVVTVTAPGGGEAWAIGSVHNITWTAADNIAVTSVDLAWSTDAGASFPNTVANGVSNSGSYAWTVPGLPSAAVRVRVTAHDAAGNPGADSSHADFSITGWTIAASSGANGGITPAGTVGVADGATPAYSITPAFGYHVADVLVNGGPVGAVTNYNFAPVHANQTISATFAMNVSDTLAPVVTVSAPVGGEIWPIGSIRNITWSATDNVGVTTVDLAYSTDNGATFPNAIASGLANSGSFAWTVTGLPTSGARVRVTARDGSGNSGADSSHANFTFAGWTVTASAGPGGTIVPSGAVGVGDGATPAFTLTPGPGFHVADVVLDGASVGAVTSYTFAPVHADHTLSVSFASSSFTLSVATIGNGSVAKSPDQPEYSGGTTVTLTATPAAGWSFAGWSGDAGGVANPLGVVMDANKSLTATFSPHAYTWNQTGTAAWATSANWTPARSAPAADDQLIFSAGGSVTVTGVPSQTIGQLRILGSSTVALQTTAAATLALAGVSGTGLDIAAGSALVLNGSSALSLALNSGATGTIRGSVSVSGAAHRLFAAGAGGLVFQAGSQLTLGAGFSGNIFGTGVAPGALNSVVFQGGSLLAQGAGANPFGASAPNAVVTFQPGSRFRLDAALTPSMSGRSYADFENNNSGSLTPSGTNSWSMDSLIITQGTLNLASLSGGGTIRGNLVIKPGATLGFSPGAALALNLAGSAAQSVNVQGTFATNAAATIVVNNASGVTLANNLTLAGTLSFVHGTVTTGGSTLVLAATGTVAGAGPASGWVSGNLKRTLAAGASSARFDVGDAPGYGPVTVAFSGAAAAFDLTAASRTPDHPSLAASDLDPARSVNRYWSLVPTGSPAFTGFDATFTYGTAEVDPGGSPANFLVRRFSGSWTAATVGTRTATTTQATGVTGFGEFAIAELKPVTYTIMASAGANGGISPSGAVVVGAGSNSSFTMSPAAGYDVADVLVDGVSVGPVTAYAFTNVTADHSIATSFMPSTSGVSPGAAVLALGRPEPNPSVGPTRLGFSLPAAGRAELDILDVNGRRVWGVEAQLAIGPHAWTWTGRTMAGVNAGAGLYFVRLRTAWGMRMERLVRLR